MVFAPLLVLAGLLSRARAAAVARYSKLLSGSHRVFAQRWLDRPDAPADELLGSPDPSSQVDAANA
jgi:hypothetical protein